MIAVDTNILVYAHRRDSGWHEAAFRSMAKLAEGLEPWGVPWPCIDEFLAIVTHLRIYRPPTPVATALRQIEIWMESPSLRLLGELQGHWGELRMVLATGKITGGAAHDPHVAAICREHGVREFWSADRDFTRIRGLLVRNPLVV
jgi:toxin-antitoxin system PIN domain toxin